MSTGEGAGVDYATARGRDWPSVRQFNVFLENRVGGLLSVVRRFEATDVRIVSLIVNDLEPQAFVGKEWVSVWRDFMGLDDYVIVRADKPRSA